MHQTVSDRFTRIATLTGFDPLSTFHENARLLRKSAVISALTTSAVGPTFDRIAHNFTQSECPNLSEMPRAHTATEIMENCACRSREAIMLPMSGEANSRQAINVTADSEIRLLVRLDGFTDC